MRIKICVIGLMLGLGVCSQAALYQFGTLAGGSAIGVIPDDSTVGTSGLAGSYFTASGLDSSISDLTLTFVLQGGDSTDLSGYLRLGSSYYYDLTTSIQGSALSSGYTYTIDFTESPFQSTFNGQNPNGTWTLFLADTVNGDTTTLNGWSLDITAVPEAETWFAAALAGALGAFWVSRQFWGPRLR